MSCKKIKKKILQAPRLCQACVKANSFFAMQSNFSPLLFANDLQKTKITVKYMIPSPFILKTLKNLHSNLCLFLLIIPEKFIKINTISCSAADPASFAWEGTF